MQDISSTHQRGHLGHCLLAIWAVAYSGMCSMHLHRQQLYMALVQKASWGIGILPPYTTLFQISTFFTPMVLPNENSFTENVSSF